MLYLHQFKLVYKTRIQIYMYTCVFIFYMIFLVLTVCSTLSISKEDKTLIYLAIFSLYPNVQVRVSIYTFFHKYPTIGHMATNKTWNCTVAIFFLHQKKNILCVVAHTFSPSTEEADVDGSQFQVSLIYILSFRTVKGYIEYPASKQTNKKQKKFFPNNFWKKNFLKACYQSN